MGSATSVPAAGPSVVSSAAAATTAVRGHAHHDQPVIPRMDFNLAVAYASIALVSLLASFNLVPVYAHMMVATVATIYIGSRYALKCWKIEGTNGVDADGNEFNRSAAGEQMQTKDAMMFPVIGSCVLFSLYLVYKFLPKDWVNFFIKMYFFLFGCIVLAQKLAQILSSTLPVPLVHSLLKMEYNVPNPMWVFQQIENALMPVLSRIPFLGYGQPAAPPAAGTPAAAAATEAEKPAEFWLPLSMLDLIALAIAIVISVIYVSTGSWLCSNLFGISFSIQGIEMLSLGSYLNGCILLSGLFIYDVFWVFGTDVMVTVAKSFDAPIKLLFPQFGTTGAPSMLGLGDIVIPGIFIALLLRYDIWRNIQTLKGAAKRANKTLTKAELHDVECLYCHVEKQKSLNLYYFNTNLVAYFIGLSTTVFVMYTFKAAQPALLYLVPACLGASLVLSFVKKDFPTLWKYTENEEEPRAATATPAAATSGATEMARTSTSSTAASSRAAPAEEEEEEEAPAAASVTKRNTSSKKKRSARAD